MDRALKANRVVFQEIFFARYFQMGFEKFLPAIKNRVIPPYPLRKSGFGDTCSLIFKKKHSQIYEAERSQIYEMERSKNM